MQKLSLKLFRFDFDHLPNGKVFCAGEKRAWQTDYELDAFYTDPENGYLQFYESAYEEIVQVYNKLRNYLTKKVVQ